MPAPHAAPACLHLHQAAPKVALAGAEVALERKQALLLAYLAHEGPTARGRLAGLLWPDAAEARARGNLRQRLAVLRQATGRDLVADSRGVLALAPGVSMQTPAGPATPLLPAFEYDDCPDAAAWLDTRRTQQQTQERDSLRQAVRQAVQAGQLDEALRRADALMALDRESEEAYRTQMEVLYLRGDSAAAIAVWDRCKTMLRQLYGVLPSAATRQLGETILQAASSAGRLEATQTATRAAPQAIPASVLRPPTLVGRQALLQTLLAQWRAGQHLCVSGEAGLGKSRLLAEFAAAAGPCASAAARPGDTLLPYASLSRLLFAAMERFDLPFGGAAAQQAARLLPRLAAHLPGAPPQPVHTDYERRQCLLAVQGLLAQAVARGCRALLFDDLQFADAASAEAVFEMAEASAAGALPLVLGVRGHELGDPVALLLQALVAGGRCQRVELQPLDAAAVAELVASLGLAGVDTATLAQRLWRQVGGNPAFVLESVKLLLALGGQAADCALPLAPDILAVIERRINLLSPAARHLAQLAAVAGDSYSVPLAAAALACAPLALSEPLRELELRQVLYGRQFVHDVIAVGVRRTVAQSVAEFMHRFVADYLQQHGGEPARVATHWQACGEALRAGQAYMQAADAAAAASRPVEQCQLLDQASACFESADATDALFDALYARQGISAAPDRAATRLARLQRLQALAANPEQRLRVLLLQQSWETDHQKTDSVAVGLRAIDDSLAQGRPDLALEFARNTAWRLAMTGQEALALQTLDARRTWATQHGSADERAGFHIAEAGVLGFCDHLQPAIEAGRQAVAQMRAAGQWASTLPALSNMGLMLYWRGELQAAKAVLGEAAELRDRMHGSGSALLIDVNLGMVQRDLGEYTAAEGRFSAVIRQLQAQATAGGDIRTDLVMTENHLAQLWLSLGQTTRALDLLGHDDSDVAMRFQARRLALRLRAARCQGRADTTLLARAQALLPAHESPIHRALLALEIGWALEPAAALRISLDLLALPAVQERPGLQLHAAVLGTQAALALGDTPTTQRLGAQATMLAARVAPMDTERSLVWHTLAELHLAAGRSAEAQALRAEAEQWLQAVVQHGVAPAWRETFLQAQRTPPGLVGRAVVLAQG